MANVSNFLAATRQNWLKIPTKSFPLGDMTQFDLPKVGLLSRIFLMVKGTLTVTPGTGVATYKDVHDGKPFGLIKEVRVKVNSGLTICKLSGYELYLLNLLQHVRLPDVAGTGVPGGYANSRAYAFGSATGANAVRFMLEIPIALNEKDPVGLLLLGTADTVVTVEIDWAVSTDLFTFTNDAAATWSGSLYTVGEVFSIPVRKEDRPALDTVHALISQPFDIPAVGETAYSMERGNIYLRLIDRIVLNGARAGLTDVDSLAMRYNGNQYPYQGLDADVLAAIARARYGRDLPQGVFCWDFNTQGMPAYGSARDWIASQALTEFEQLVTIAAGATLGANNNKLQVIREMLIPVAA